MKTCSKCDEVKDLNMFFKDKSFKDGHMKICKVCKQSATYKWREENREKYNAVHTAWANKNYYKLRLQRYKITPEQHVKMLSEQGGRCAICSKLPQGKRPLVVDHCHDTGKVRGLLCYGCNRALHTLDNKELLRKALDYLDKCY